jgi:predicted nucleotidyltransferase
MPSEQKECGRIMMIKPTTERPEVYTVDEIKKRIIPVFKENNIKKAVLFGSYASDAAHRKSDIDILVDSGLRGLKFCGFAYDVQTALEKDADIYDVYYLPENSPLADEIARTGMTIYERE